MEHWTFAEDTSVEVPDHLLDLNRDPSVGTFLDRDRVDARIDGIPLPDPIPANCFTTLEPSSFPGVGPVDVVSQRFEQRVDVALIEGCIEGSQLRCVSHAVTIRNQEVAGE